MLVSMELPDVLEFSDWSAALNSTTNRTLWMPPDAVATNQVQNFVWKSFFFIYFSLCFNVEKVLFYF
jgi:hypothetical protein